MKAQTVLSDRNRLAAAAKGHAFAAAASIDSALKSAVEAHADRSIIKNLERARELLKVAQRKTTDYQAINRRRIERLDEDDRRQALQRATDAQAREPKDIA